MRRSSSNDSWGTSTQRIINQVEREEETESYNSDGNSVNSDRSKLIQTDRKVDYKQCIGNIEPSTSTADATAK